MTLTAKDHETLARVGFNREEADALERVWSVPFFETMLLCGEDAVHMRDAGLSLGDIADAIAHGIYSSDAIVAKRQGFTMHQFHVMTLNTRSRGTSNIGGVVRSLSPSSAPPDFFVTAFLANEEIGGIASDLATYEAAARGEPGPDGHTRSVAEVVAAVETLVAFRPVEVRCGCDL